MYILVLPVCLYAGTYKGQKRALDSMKVVVTYGCIPLCVLGTKPKSFARTKVLLNAVSSLQTHKNDLLIVHDIKIWF